MGVLEIPGIFGVNGRCCPPPPPSLGIEADIWNQSEIFSINAKSIEVVEECIHLGIKRDSVLNSGHSTTVEDRITSARGCAYSLMGASLFLYSAGRFRRRRTGRVSSLYD